MNDISSLFVCILFGCLVITSNAQEGFEQWLENDQAIISNTNDGEHEYRVVNLSNGKEKLFKDELPAKSAETPSQLSLGDGKRIVPRGDDLFLVFDNGQEQQLTDDPAVERNPKISSDGKYVAFTKLHDLYVLDLGSGVEKQLTFDGSETIYNGWASWVYYEEILGRRSRYAAFWWSPDNTHIAFLRFDDAPVPTFTLFRSEGNHGNLEVNHYPKAGDPNPDVKFGVANANTGELVWVDEDATKDQYSALPFWTPDGKHLLIQEVNRGQDTLQIIKANPNTGKREVIYEESQPTWVEFYEEMTFFENGDFLLRSNKDGWYNLYRYNLNGDLVLKMTDVPWRVLEVIDIDEKKNLLFFYGAGDSPTDRHLFSVSLDGRNLTKHTKEDGWHSVNLSPSKGYFFDRYDALDYAGAAALISVSGKRVRDLAIEVEDQNTVAGVQVEHLVIPTDDGFDLPAYWVLPKNFDKDRSYPVVFSIYGGPDAGAVSNRYRSYAGNFFTNHDVILFVMDHRASGKFGKKGLNYMHRSLGKWELHDLIQGVEWLRKKPFVDKTRIGIMGGSYGGYITALALTYGAEYFTHGVSLFPVTDWRLYDNVYTERYMDTPEENPEGYDFGSAITHADNLKGKLLIVHGMMDDNVHMQNTMQFASKLQDLGKEFEMMVYPGERHGWGGPKRAHLTKLTNGFWSKYFLEQETTSKILKP